MLVSPPIDRASFSFSEQRRKVLSMIRQSLDRGISDQWIELVLGDRVNTPSVLRALAAAGEIECIGEIRPGEVAWIAAEWAGSGGSPP
jgi:hypothetical protein